MSLFIFIVDDNEDFREMLGELLRQEGLRVDTAGNGREAWRELKEEGARPALILLDLDMPIMDGRELLALLRRDEGLAAIPIALISASADARDLGLPAIDKCADLDEIRSAIDRHARH